MFKFIFKIVELIDQLYKHLKIESQKFCRFSLNKKTESKVTSKPDIFWMIIIANQLGLEFLCEWNLSLEWVS